MRRFVSWTRRISTTSSVVNPSKRIVVPLDSLSTHTTHLGGPRVETPSYAAGGVRPSCERLRRNRVSGTRRPRPDKFRVDALARVFRTHDGTAPSSISFTKLHPHCDTGKAQTLVGCCEQGTPTIGSVADHRPPTARPATIRAQRVRFELVRYRPQWL